MTAERWRQIELLYHGALEREPEERSLFLNDACAGDQSLRREVESLLASHEQAGNFIESPAGDLAAGMLADKQTPSMIGRMLGRYQLRELLGKGGMGEVYGAKDMMLGREVAVKILPEHLAQDPEALLRFEREAMAVAALSHTNILAIYDFGVEQSVSYAVTELLEGETLRARLGREPMPWRMAAEIAAAAAEGLAVAHSKGIIHRDLKPENIFLTEDGQVKILDFGIARVKSVASDDATTLTLKKKETNPTDSGTLLGTIGYMSPEQLRAEHAEAPSDIFSLGCVLFEAVGGRRPFARTSEAETIAAILQEPPTPLAESGGEVPEELERLILRCLEKSPKERFQSAHDLAFTLKTILAGKKVAQASMPSVRLKRPGIWIGASAAALLVVLAVLQYLAGDRERRALLLNKDADANSKSVTITPLTITGNISGMALSPDGKYAVYATLDKPNQSTLWLQQIAAPNRRAIIPSSEVRYSETTISRDGNYIYYTAITKESPYPALYRVSVLGGPVSKVLDWVETKISFSPDGSQFVFRRSFEDRRESVLFIADVDGSREKEIASIRYPEFFNGPAWSPDGKLIACGSGLYEGTANMYVVGVSVHDWSVKQISAARWEWVGQMEWMPDSSGLMMIAQDQQMETRRIWLLSYPSGEARRITNDAVDWHRLSLSADASALAGTQSQLVSNVWLIPAADASRAKQITFGAGGYRGGVSWTPDGKIVVSTGAGSFCAITMIDADGNNPKQLTGETFSKEGPGAATVTRDGRYIVFTSDLKGGRHIWRMNIDGGNPIQLTNGGGEEHPHCSPDGRWVVYVRMETHGVRGPTLWKVSIDGGEPTQLTDAIAAFPVVSPDGKLIACLTSEESVDTSGRPAIFPFEGGRPVKLFPQTIPSRPIQWTPDGRGITYAENPFLAASKIWIQPIDGGEPRLFAEFERDRVFSFEWSRDGKYLACVRGLWAINAALVRDFR